MNPQDGSQPTVVLVHGAFAESASWNGVIRHQGETYENVILVSGFSKAYSSLLSFLALPTRLKDILKVAAPPYLYSGPSPVASLATTITGLRVNDARGDLYRFETYRMTRRVLERYLRRLGRGLDEVERIVDWLVKQFKNKNGTDLAQDKIARQRLQEAAEKAKIELSSAQETQINLPFITADASGPKHLNIKLTRAKLESLVEDLIQRTLAPLKACMKDAGVTTVVCACDPVMLALGFLGPERSVPEQFGCELEQEDFHTMAGLVFGALAPTLAGWFVTDRIVERARRMGPPPGLAAVA
jgi:hypothetical protein